MPNMGHAIAKHNAKILNDEQTINTNQCNCRQGKENCPVNGQCLGNNVIYRAAVTTEDDGNTEFYVGLTSRPFKRRLYEHNGDKKNPARRTKTCLSKHVWRLQDENRTFQTHWDIIDRAPAFNPVNKKCRLCLKEKFYILHTPYNSTINDRNEIWTPCRHRFSGLLSKK